jgi:tetratricopeptide (TPR) repeat protein
MPNSAQADQLRELPPHPTAQLLARIRSGCCEPERIERELLPHLLRLCPACKAADDELQRLRLALGHDERARESLEGPEAQRLFAQLVELPHDRLLAAADGDPTFRSWGLCRLLQRIVVCAMDFRPRPEVLIRLARAGLRIARQLETVCDRRSVCDLRAVGYACLGRARCTMGELHAAEDAFDVARTLRARGTAAPWAEAEVLALEARLRCGQHRLAEAVALLERVLAILADWPGLQPADQLALKAWCVYHLGDVAAAETILEEAKGRCDETRQPELALDVGHGLVWCAIVLGRFDDAAASLPKAVELARRLGNRRMVLLLLKAAGHIARAQGNKRAAAERLRQAAEELAEMGFGVDAMLAWCELAAVYLEQGARDAVRRLSGDVGTLLLSPQLRGPHIGQLVCFQHACCSDELTGELVSECARAFEQARSASLAWWSAWRTVLTVEEPAASRQKPSDRPRAESG